MSKVLAVIKREYLTRVTSRGFLIWTILTPLLGAGLILGPGLYQERTARQGRIVVLDQSGDAELFARAQKLFAKNIASSQVTLQQEVLAPTANSAEQTLELSRQLSNGKLLGFLLIRPDVFTPQGKLLFHAPSSRDRSLTIRLRDAFNSAVLERRFAREGLSGKRFEELLTPLDLTLVSDQRDGSNREAFFLAVGMMTVLYGMIIFYGNLVMRGVIEEKQSRIMEVLLSSLRPFDLMLGKLIGIGLVSLTQVGLWLLSLALLSMASAAPALASNSFKLPPLAPLLLVFFFIFFVLGYFLFSTLYLIIGAMVSTEEDAQQLQMPVMLSIVVPMILLEHVLRQPNSFSSVLLSLIPIFSPILMFGRISVQLPPFWQIGLSIALLLGAIWAAVWVAAKIYRVGALMYGKPPNLPELLRWLRYS